MDLSDAGDQIALVALLVSVVALVVSWYFNHRQLTTAAQLSYRVAFAQNVKDLLDRFGALDEALAEMNGIVVDAARGDADAALRVRSAMSTTASLGSRIARHIEDVASFQRMLLVWTNVPGVRVTQQSGDLILQATKSFNDAVRNIMAVPTLGEEFYRAVMSADSAHISSMMDTSRAALIDALSAVGDARTASHKAIDQLTRDVIELTKAPA